MCRSSGSSGRSSPSDPPGFSADARDDTVHLAPQRIEAGCIRLRKCADNDIPCHDHRQHPGSHQLSQSSPQSVSLHDRVPVLGYDHSHAWGFHGLPGVDLPCTAAARLRPLGCICGCRKRSRGSGDPDIQQSCLNPLPRSPYELDFRCARHSLCARKSQLRREPCPGPAEGLRAGVLGR